MSEFLNHFHFLRPEWFWGILLCPLLWWLQGQRQRLEHDWARVIDPRLLRWLTPGQGAGGKAQRSILPMLILVLGLGALAGPAWEKKPQPVLQLEDHLVVVFDLSLSMLATDISPNRLTRARQKLQDLLNLRNEGFTALVVFSGDAHVVTPLTDDTYTIAANIPALDPYIMPVIGARPDRGVEEALRLLEQAGVSRGRIVLMTDGVETHQGERIDALLSPTPHTLHILATGTAGGGPVQLKDGQFLKDQGAVVIPKTNLAHLRRLAENNGGQMQTLALDDSDLEALDIQADRLRAQFRQQAQQAHARHSDLWQDRGYLLVALLIPLVLLARRQGALLLWLLMIAQPQPAQAFSWADLWQTRDQQGQAKLQAGDAEAAAQLFESPEHQAYAAAKAGEYASAAEKLADLDTARAHYNRGNALAHAGQYAEAIAAYETALAQAPELEDAQHNKSIVEELLKQQEEQQNNSQQNQNAEDQNEQDSQQESSDNSEHSNQNNADQQAGDSSQPKQGQQDSAQPQSGHQQSEQAPQQAEQAPSPQDPSEQPDDVDSASQQARSEQAGEDQQAEGQGIPEAHLSAEDKQSFEQWMRRVPDDPAGLLRNKFRHQATERNYEENPQGEPLW